MNFYQGLYYWHAASYGNCSEPKGNSGCASASVGACGFQTDHNVTLYTSPDFETWSNAGVAFTATGNLPPNSVLFAPKTVFNARNNNWVMFYNYIVGSFSNSFYGVATSPTPEGPFTVVNHNLQLQYSDNGDEGIFVDDDGTAYIIYTTLSHGHAMSIERLSENYTWSLGAAASSGLFGDTFVEAPAMFKRGSVYYATFGSCCCYCGSGSEVHVYTASSPLGPYTKQSVLGGAPPPPPPALALALAAPPQPNGTVSAVLSAEYGLSCGVGANVTSEARSACVGSANCTWFVCVCGTASCPGNPAGCIPDPAYGCEKDLRVTWECSGDPAGAPPRAAYVPKPAEGLWAEISCFPPQPAPPAPPTPFGSQQTDVFFYFDSAGVKQFMYIGDHWQSAPDGTSTNPAATPPPKNKPQPKPYTP
jgi:hypothetical protein